MIRRFVRAVAGAGTVLCVSAMSCPEPVGPEGLVPAGDFRLVRATPDKTWEVPVSSGVQSGCGALTDARLLIGEDGSVLYSRTIRYVADGQTLFSEQEFRGKLEKNSASTEIALRYGRVGRDDIRPQVEPTAGDPEFTVLYVDHYFPGNASCAGRRVILRYTIGGVNY